MKTKSTTYTVIRRLSQRGIIENKNATVRSLISEEEIQNDLVRTFVNEYFNGSILEFQAALLRVGMWCDKTNATSQHQENVGGEISV